jgi:SAM-dependent methyltransferase
MKTQESCLTEAMENKIHRAVTDGHGFFWRRFGGAPNFLGQRILEIGSGHGALSVEMALQGANRVVGVDIRKQFAAAATSYVDKRQPDIANRLEFTVRPLSELPSASFDLIISKDSFEHIIDVPAILRDISRVLTPDGRVFVGFSPFYYSPYGDHDRRLTAFRNLGLLGKMLAAIPWGHLVLEPWIIRNQNRIQDFDVRSMQDLNLNKLSIGDFRTLIQSTRLKADYFAVNQGKSYIGAVLSKFRSIPGLEKYVTYNLYCILRRIE